MLKIILSPLCLTPPTIVHYLTQQTLNTDFQMSCLRHWLTVNGQLAPQSSSLVIPHNSDSKCVIVTTFIKKFGRDCHVRALY